jgi:hypothetical protein
VPSSRDDPATLAPPAALDYPLWLWPNLVGLDAPAVAVVWQRFLGAGHGVRVPAGASVVLGLVVWGVYLADRWLDAHPGRRAEAADRHRFARRHRTAIGVVALAATVAAGVAALLLPAAYIGTGAAVAVGLAAYMVGIHAVGRPAVGDFGKAFLVGLLFAAGVVVPLAAERPHEALAWLPAVGAFAAACWLNCRLIAGWEAPGRDRSVAPLAAGALALGLAAVAPRAVGLAVACGVGLLLALHLGRGAITVRARRVLADIALLTPLVVGAAA